MKCDIPGCENDVVERITRKSVFMGVVGECSLGVCDGHDSEEIANELRNRGEQHARQSQQVNPFFKCKSLDKSCS